jgi:UDP-glucose 4-epimerase
METYRKGEVVPIGNLWPRRDYVFAQDVADALIALSVGPADWDVFNVGTGVGTTVVDILETVGRITGSPVRYEQVAERIRADDGHLVSDNSKILARTGWRPRYDVERGLRELLAWDGLRGS